MSIDRRVIARRPTEPENQVELVGPFVPLGPARTSVDEHWWLLAFALVLLGVFWVWL